jgi:hypothetical protein
MGTRNFKTTMAKHVYVLDEDITKDYDSLKDWIDNVAPSEIASHLAVNINDLSPTNPRSFGIGDRDYSAKNIASHYEDHLFDVIAYRIGIHLFIVNGYYEGANLDYDISFELTNWGEEECLSQYNNEESMSANIIEYSQSFDDFNDIIRSYIQAKRFDNVISNRIKEAREKAEDLCNYLTGYTYKIEASLSDGTAIYKKQK